MRTGDDPSVMIDRLNAALEGRYRIERELGEGGMATVYLAEDLKHDRQVAIKVLKPELAAVVGAERFLTEIKTTAQLQHPHILPLHDSGEADGFLFYVMPYVEGESLRERLDREQQLPVEEAVELARKVADALQYAHEQDVVHRDIKPANILLSRGNPLVADFGIALAVSQAGGGRITETGLSLGTPHYMSPEQASGERTVDRRSDVYGLGCVLYEMLAGEPPYGGPTSQAVLARILTTRPQRVAGLRATVPPHVDAAVAKSLEKLPADRFSSARELRDALADPGFRHTTVAGTETAERAAQPGGGRARDLRLWALAAGNVLLLLALVWAVTRSTEVPQPPAHRYVIEDSLREGLDVHISPTGDVIYEAEDAEGPHIRLRRATETRPVEVPNTDDAYGFSFSPDGEWVVFAADQNEVKKVQLATGTTVTLVPGGTLGEIYTTEWTEDGSVLLAGPGGIHRVPDVGGAPEQITALPSAFARLLPGGDALLHTIVPGGSTSQARVMVTNLETGDTTTVVPVGGNAIWSPTGHILYGHPSATVFAVPFDLDRLETTGAPVPVQEDVLTLGAVSFFDLSPAGSLVYIGGAGVSVSENDIELAWMRMDGTLDVLPLDPTDHGDVRVSPDGRQIGYTREDQIYVFDLDRGTNQRLTFEGSRHHNPVWSPDGQRLAFSSEREDSRGGVDLYVKDVDGRSPTEWLAGAEDDQFGTEWLDDGTLLLISNAGPGAQTDILMVEPNSQGEPTPLLRADWSEGSPRVSPDGRLMSYSSNETGETHLFVREFPGMAGRWQVSEEPVEGPSAWAPSGDAIFYESGEGPELIRADLELEPSFRVVSRTVLHDQGLINQLADVHPDGERLLVTRSTGIAAAQQTDDHIVVVANWLTELRRRLGEEE